MTWLMNNMATIIVTAVLLAAVIAAVRYIHKSKKTGTCAGCGGSCSGCTHCSSADRK